MHAINPPHVWDATKFAVIPSFALAFPYLTFLPLNISMDLLEIRLEVVKYLEDKDLFTCILVNKAWNDMFLPSLYSSLHILDQ